MLNLIHLRFTGSLRVERGNVQEEFTMFTDPN